jgi:hypothetical protein
MRIDGSSWFVFTFLVVLAALGAFCVLFGLFLLISLLVQEHREEREPQAEELDLQQEQAMAVAVAEASISQDFNDRYPFYRAMYAEILHGGDSGPMPCV